MLKFLGMIPMFIDSDRIRIMNRVTLTIPADLYDRARRLAAAAEEPIEAVLLRQIEQSINDPLANLHQDEQAELHALAYLSDEALWTIAREKMPADKQAHLQILMDKNNLGDLSAAEQDEFNQLIEQGQKLMLRKAQAASLLTQRGYQVTAQSMDE
jgi:hypothetical protein